MVTAGFAWQWGAEMRGEIHFEKLQEEQTQTAAEVLARAFHDQPPGRSPRKFRALIRKP